MTPATRRASTSRPASLLDPARRARPLSAERLAPCLEPPTAEQAAVDRGAAATPRVVVAGAGSGKTETMAARVVWLVGQRAGRAGPGARPDLHPQGRRRAGDRVRIRLRRLRQPGCRPTTAVDGAEPGAPASRPSRPTTRTPRAGRASTRCGSASSRAPGCSPRRRAGSTPRAWSATYDGPMDAVDWAERPSSGDVLALAGELAEHLRRARRRAALTAGCGAAPARAAAGTGAALAGLRRGGRLLAVLAGAGAQLLPLVRALRRAQARAGAMDFGDQVALAAADRPRPPGGRRDRARPVRGGAARRVPGHRRTPSWCCSRALFGGGHPVTAVGDPLPVDLRLARGERGQPAPVPAATSAAAAGEPAPVLQLTTSFRNGERILRRRQRSSSDGTLRARGRPVPRLRPAARPARAPGEVGARCCRPSPTRPPGSPTRSSAGVARLPAGAGEPHWARDGGAGRKRSQFARLRGALRARGCRSRWSAWAACWPPRRSRRGRTLRVLADPTAGAALLRLLTGARWRIGPRDLDALGRAGAPARPRRPRRRAATTRARRSARPVDESRRPGRRAGRPAARRQRVLAREGYAAAGRARATSWPAAAPPRPAAARPGRRRRAHARPRRRGRRPPRPGRRRPAAPDLDALRRAWPRSSSARRRGRPTLVRVPRLPGRRRGRGARPEAGRGRGGRRRGPAADRARRQGPGVGRGRGGRAWQPAGVFPAEPPAGRRLDRAASRTLPFPLRGDRADLPAATGRGARPDGAGRRSPAFARPAASAARGRSAGWPTSR